MNYVLDIIDTIDDSHVLSLENAIAKSIILKYNGGDQKDELFVVGSSLAFTLIHSDIVDAKFIDLFTSDENKFKVRLYKESNFDDTIWQGFLLPESYSEPYTNSVVSINFIATDGLGRLKGKYLPDDFYTDEKSVIEIIAKCLEQTGLQLDLYFTAAIDNATQKNYHEIYINTENFIDDGKKQDVYTILYDLLYSMVCTVYQADDVWYIEGLNVRHRKINTFKKYSYLGVYDDEISKNRLIKSIKPFATPVVTMVSPYKNITVNHSRVKKSLPDTIAVESNDGWAITTGVNGFVYATHWNGNNDVYAKAKSPDYKITLLSNVSGSLDTTKFINLRKKIYVCAGDKFSFSAEFENIYAKNYTSSAIENLVDDNEWVNVLRVDIVIAGEIYSSNTLSFNTERLATLEFDILVETSGLMDIKLFQPFKLGSASIKEIAINKLELDEIDFTETLIIENEINEDYSIQKEVNLVYADDNSAFSKSFQLAKLNASTLNYNEISVPILYGFTQNDNYYSVVDLEGANLIKDNIDYVYYNSVLLTDLEVIYNYNNGEQMVIVTPSAMNTGNFDVKVYQYDDYTTDRTNWQEWTDTIYQIEKERYSTVISNIYRRLFIIPHQKIDLTVNNAVKFNDILKFNYIQQSNYIITNSSWDIDSGETTITMVKGFYQNDDVVEPGDTLPPIIDAGEDQNIENSTTNINLAATAYSPDGFIVSTLWEKISGSNGLINAPTTLVTSVSNLDDDEYTFKCTVTDNEGLTASDTVNIYRIAAHAISLTTISETTTAWQKQSIFQIAIAPNIPSNYSLKISGTYRLMADKVNQFNSADATFIIIKNDVEIFTVTNLSDYTIYENGTFEFNYISTDVIKLRMMVEASIDDEYSTGTPEAQTDIELTAYEFNAGTGEVTGLPISKTLNIVGS